MPDLFEFPEQWNEQSASALVGEIEEVLERFFSGYDAVGYREFTLIIAAAAMVGEVGRRVEPGRDTPIIERINHLSHGLNELAASLSPAGEASDD